MGVAVVGAEGYIGGRLVPILRAAGHNVVRIGRRQHHGLDEEPVRIVDLVSDPPEALNSALANCDTIVHLAGHDEVSAAREPERALLETIKMTSRVADAARRCGIRRVVYLSTVHVYGAGLQPGASITEDVVPRPRAPYALARLTSEHLLAGALSEPTELVVLRLTNSVGAPAYVDVDRWSLLVNDLCRQAATTGRLVLQTAGGQSRDWVALGDVCRAIEVASRGSEVPAGTYNLGSGQSRSVRAMAEIVADAWGAITDDRPVVEAPPASNTPSEPYIVDVERLGELDVRLDTPIESAVEEVARFCASHRAELG